MTKEQYQHKIDINNKYISILEQQIKDFKELLEEMKNGFEIIKNNLSNKSPEIIAQERLNAYNNYINNKQIN